MRIQTARSISACLLTVGVVATGVAQTPPPAKSPAASVGIFAYPAKDQKPEQQAKDESECYDWSKQQTGFDPSAPPPPPPAQPAQPEQAAQGGQRARGAVKGAAAGAVIGEVANNDASEGAAIGATAGVVAGGRQARQQKAQQQQQAQAQTQASTEQAKASQQALIDAFKRGMTACLETRGYTVK